MQNESGGKSRRGRAKKIQEHKKVIIAIGATLLIAVATVLIVKKRDSIKELVKNWGLLEGQAVPKELASDISESNMGMNCPECEGQLEQVGPREWDCLDCGAEFLKGDGTELAVCGYHSVDDDDESERLSVWEAADIYLSEGFDEDYSFGYSHEELIYALKQ